MPPIDSSYHFGRRNPATGVLIFRDRPTIVFLTVCTLHRVSTLTEQIYHNALVQAWTEADAWLVGAYLIMPDHLHLFCAPKNEEIACSHRIGSDVLNHLPSYAAAQPQIHRLDGVSPHQ